MKRELLLRFLRCETSPEEEELLADWLDADSGHRKELDELQLIMEGMALAAPELRTLNSEPVQKNLSITRWARISIAASIAVIIAAGIAFNRLSGKIDDLSGQTTTVEIPAGQRICMTLGDGTTVWLNSETKLEYPSVFRDKQRRVKLSGEAMFEVAHNASRPFVVETFACDIEVLGTKFNVMAEKDSDSFSAALMKGAIKITNRLSNDAPVVMKMNEEVKLVDGTLQLEKIKNHDEYLWPEGIISIHDVSFEKMMAKFERIFDVQIDIQRKEIPHIDYNRGKIRVSDGIDHALRVLQMTSDFSYEKDQETGVITIL